MPTTKSRTEYYREYRKTHREKINEIQRRYRAKQRAELLRLKELEKQRGGQADE